MSIFFTLLNKSFDKIIPLGEECYTCQSIDIKFNEVNLRKKSFPFDYVGHSFLNNIIEKLKSNTLCVKEDIEIKQFGDKFFLHDSRFGFCYWHDTYYEKQEDFKENDITNFLEKYNRRYKRIYEAINCDQPTIFLSVNHFDNIYIDKTNKHELIELFYHIKEKNKNCYLLAINHDDKSYFNNGLLSIKLNHERAKKFNESKLEFSQKLNSFIKSSFNCT
jgi:hypothetical protein